MGLLGNKPSKNGEGAGADKVKNWYADRYQSILVQRNALMVITLISLGASLLFSFAIMQLTPLKSVQPFVIQVDKKTGLTNTVDPVTVDTVSANESIKQYFVVKYVRARESFDVAFYTQDFKTVRLLSDPAIFAGYREFMSPDNLESPVVQYGRKNKRLISIKSFTLIDANTAQVRIQVKPVGTKVQTWPDEHKIIWVGFDFVNVELTDAERYVNPLGFRVTSYRVESDLVQGVE